MVGSPTSQSIFTRIVRVKENIVLDSWSDAGMAVYLLAFLILRRATRGLLLSLTIIYGISLASQVISNIPFIKEIGLEPVFFSVVFGLLVSNLLKVPDWMKPAIQSEFYIKCGLWHSGYPGAWAWTERLPQCWQARYPSAECPRQ